MSSTSSASDDVFALVNKINAASKDLISTNSAKARQQCLAAARSLTSALGTPVEAILRNCWAEVWRRLTPTKSTYADF